MSIMKIDPIPAIEIDPILGSSQLDFDKESRPMISRDGKVKFFKIVFFLFAILLFWNGENIASLHTVLSYEGDGRIPILADRAGMNLRGKALLLSTSPELVNANQMHTYCPWEGGESIEFGCYLPADNKIYLLDIVAEPYSEALVVTAAHEMLHAAWSELSIKEQSEVSVAIDEHIESKNDPSTQSVRSNLKEYGELSAEARTNELYAFIGSRLSEVETDEFLDTHYRKYFSSRGMSSAAQVNFTEGTDNIVADINFRTEEANRKAEELVEYESKWLAPIESYMRQNLYYRDYATYNKNVEAYNNNLANYNRKFDEYEAFLSRLNTDIKAHNDALGAMMPDKQLDPVNATIEKAQGQ